jgi:hypothetical protein
VSTFWLTFWIAFGATTSVALVGPLTWLAWRAVEEDRAQPFDWIMLGVATLWCCVALSFFVASMVLI